MNTPSSPVLELLEPRLAPAGVAITTANGVLTITGTAGNDAIHIEDLGGGMWKISDALAGPTMFKWNGAAEAASVIISAPQSIKATLNAGDDILWLDGIHVNGSTTIAANDGMDHVEFDGGSYNGAISVDAGAGPDRVEVTGTFNNTFNIKGGAGNDLIEVHDGFYARGLSADLGTDSNTFDGSFNNLTMFGSLTVTAAGGAANTQIIGLTGGDGFIAGNVLFKTTAGITNFTAGSFAATLRITGNLTVQTGIANDTFNLIGNLQVGGNVTFAAGNGDNTLSALGLDKFTCASLGYTGGTGYDKLDFEGNAITIANNATFNLGNGDNHLHFNPNALSNTTFRIGGTFGYTGGTGSDQITFDGATGSIGGQLLFKGGNGDNGVRFHFVTGSMGSASFTGGSNANNFEIGQFDGGSTLITVYGNIVSNMGTGGGATLLLREALVYGSVTHTSNIPFGHGDSAAIRESTVLGAVTININGAAQGQVDIDDSTFRSAVSISTGAGNDVVFFDVVDAFSNLRNQFHGAVKILFGAGDDTYFGGQAFSAAIATCGNDFYLSLLIDGGANTPAGDTLHLKPATDNNHFFNFVPTFKSMENQD